MSITDELRVVAAKTECANGRCEKLYRGDLDHIANRIDAEHEKAMSRAGQLLADAEKDRDYNYANWQECKQRVLQGNITFNELEAEIERLKDELSHCIELPKDADGEYIHIGDKVTLYGRRVYEVDTILFHKDNVSVSYRGESGCGCDSANNFHHHHEPTVEDVLTEFGIDWEHESDCEDRAALLKEYAAKLRLAEGEDA